MVMRFTETQASWFSMFFKEACFPLSGLSEDQNLFLQTWKVNCRLQLKFLSFEREWPTRNQKVKQDANDAIKAELTTQLKWSPPVLCRG